MFVALEGTPRTVKDDKAGLKDFSGFVGLTGSDAWLTE